MPVAAAVNWAFMLSKEPKNSSIAAPSSSVGRSGAEPLGAMFFQNTEWFTWPARLNARSFSSLLMAPKSALSRASASLSSAVLAPSTEALWCLSWWSSMISAEMYGSRAE